MALYYDLKVEVTVNDSGFDQPKSVQIDKDEDIPTCTLKFPGGQRSRHKVTRRDVFKVYMGLGDISHDPVFTGFLDADEGFIETSLELFGPLQKAQNENRLVTAYDNFDNMELGNAIAKLKNSITALSSFDILTENTGLTVPLGTRYDRGSKVYAIMKQFREFANDNTDPLRILQYALFDHAGKIHFRKSPNPDTANPNVELEYGDSLLSFDPINTGKDTINKQTVLGFGDVKATFSNAQRVLIDDIREGKVIRDTKIPTVAEALSVARNEVLSKLFDPIGMVIRSHLLIEMIPMFSVAKINKR